MLSQAFSLPAPRGSGLKGRDIIAQGGALGGSAESYLTTFPATGITTVGWSL